MEGCLIIEILDFPGLKIETWGTQLIALLTARSAPAR
jgi:hypothetical protein